MQSSVVSAHSKRQLGEGSQPLAGIIGNALLRHWRYGGKKLFSLLQSGGGQGRRECQAAASPTSSERGKRREYALMETPAHASNWK